MSTDPKKNDEVKDEELEGVAGGAGKDQNNERPIPGSGDDTVPGPEDGLQTR